MMVTRGQSDDNRRDGNPPIGGSEPPLVQVEIVARHDPLSERIRQQINQLMEGRGRDGGRMEQRELARRAKLSQDSVHKFLKGQKPYPPLTFLDRLLRVFGYTLPEALSETVLPVKPLPEPRISKPIVLEIAALLEKPEWNDGALQALKEYLQHMRPRQPPKRR
jgi:transcriptional regulator with XRE-family HTH domain